jgi:DNA-binding beta-propeller fold protein YncE
MLFYRHQGRLFMVSTWLSRIVCIPAAGALIFSGCVNNLIDSGPPAPGSALFIVESDFQSGLLEWMPLDGGGIVSQGLSIHMDAGVAAYEGFVYVIERFGADNILKYDPSGSGPSGVLYQKHLGDNWNPQDIEFVSAAKAYVSNQDEPRITVFNPTTGAVVSHIDISAYTYMPDSNTSPHAGDLQLAGGDVYAILQRRNGFLPGAPTLLLRISTRLNAVIDTIPLRWKNGASMSYADGALYVSNPGSSLYTGDGGIEKVTLSTKTVTTVMDETALGGNPGQIVHKGGSRFYVVNYVGWKNVPVVEIDAAAGTVVASLPGVKDAYGGICYDAADSLLYVGERDSVESGIRVYRDTVQQGSPVKSARSLPPAALVVVRGSVHRGVR